MGPGSSGGIWSSPASTAGTVAAMIDRCLHRSTRLSVGCVDRDALRCAYHGWRWDAAGAV